MDQEVMNERRLKAVNYYATDVLKHLRGYQSAENPQVQLTCLLNAHSGFALLNYFAGLPPLMKHTHQIWTASLGLNALIQLQVVKPEAATGLVEGLIASLDAMKELWGEDPNEQMQMVM